MTPRMFFLTIVICVLSLAAGFSQNKSNIYPLRSELKKVGALQKQEGYKPSPSMDSTRTRILNGTALEYLNFNPDSALIFARQELSLAEKTGLKKDIAREHWYIGLLYSSLGNFPEALKNYYTCLKLQEEIGNKNGIANVDVSIGMIYYNQGIYTEALTNFNVSLKLFAETGDKTGMAWVYGNIGAVCSAQGKYIPAINFIVTGLKIFEELGMKEAVAGSYYSLGSITLSLGNYSESLKNCFTALNYRDVKINPDGVADIYLLIGQVYEKKGMLQEALGYELRGLNLASGTKNKALLKKANANLASVYYRLGSYKAAYDHEILFQELNDSLYSSENQNRMASLKMQYEFDKKVQADSIERSHENKINLLNLQKQKTYTGMGIAGFILVMLLLFFVYRNYTNQRKATAEMAIARHRAEQSEQFEQQFLAKMSHEIRTPMNAVMGMTDLLIDKHPRDDQQAYLEGIKKSSVILLHILNDILDLSKIEAGKMEFEKIDFSLAGMLDLVNQTLRHKAEEKGLDLKVIMEDNIPDVRLGDPFRLNQVLINLAGNAIKFTGKGSVSIEVRKGAGDSQIIFSISDTGIGIPEDKLNTVFESFTQASASDTRRFGGTGLGLSISKQMVELMGGNISVSSREGAGTTFSFEILCPAGSEERLNEQKITEQIDGSILDGLKILLVDDNEYNRIVAGDTLKSKAGINITEAVNGLEALELMGQQDFDLVLMDVQMPVMDGHEATRRIRTTLSAPKNQTPVIALTASVIRSDLDKCIESGMNDYIAKPVKASQLISVIAKATGREIRFSEKKNIQTVPGRKKDSHVSDLAYLTKFCENDNLRMQKYIAMFLASAQPLIEKINTAMDHEDLQEIASQVHGHKTKFIMMGMQDVKNLADIIEMQCREGKNPGEVRENVRNLTQQIGEAISELKAIS